jgi:lysophospholipase L1-like esterase
VAGVAFGAALFEVLLRLLGPAEEVPGLRRVHQARPDRPWLYGLLPGARSRHSRANPVEYAVNADGFRDPSRAREKPAGTLRLLVLGDSVTFGFGVAREDTFPAQLELRLARRAPAEVLNFGVGGYNPYTEAALLADRGLAYQPDLVLVQFSPNDLNDPTLHFDAHTRLLLGELPAAAFPDPAHRLPLPPRRAPEACRRIRVCGLVDDARLALFRRRAGILERTFAPRLELPPGPERRWLAGLYGEMARAAGSIGAGFAVVAFPDRSQVDGGVSDRLQQDLIQIGREGGWPALSLVPAFRAAAAAGPEPLFLDPWHPSAAGHRVAAEAILRELETRDLLGRAGPPAPARG